MNELDQIKADEAEAKPVWVTVKKAVALFGVSRARLFRLIKENKIKTRCLKTRRDNERGIRLISYDSLNNLIESCTE